MSENVQYHQLYDSLLFEAERMHDYITREIRRGLWALVGTTVLFLTLMFLTKGSKVIFLLLWIVIMFTLAALLMVMEYVNYLIKTTIERVTQQEQAGLGETLALPKLERPATPRILDIIGRSEKTDDTDSGTGNDTDADMGSGMDSDTGCDTDDGTDSDTACDMGYCTDSSTDCDMGSGTGSDTACDTDDGTDCDMGYCTDYADESIGDSPRPPEEAAPFDPEGSFELELETVPPADSFEDEVEFVLESPYPGKEDRPGPETDNVEQGTDEK